MNEMRALIATEAKLLFREPIIVARGDRPADGHPADLRLALRATTPDPGARRPALHRRLRAVAGRHHRRDARHPDAADPARDLSREGRPAAAVDDAGRTRSGCWSRSSSIYMVMAVVALVLLVVVGQRRVRGPAARASPSATSSRSCSACRRCSRSACWSRRSRRRPGVATAVAIPMFFVVMFLGGVYLPRVLPAGRPDPDRRLHAARRPGPPGRLAGDGAAAGAARSGWPC